MPRLKPSLAAIGALLLTLSVVSTPPAARAQAAKTQQDAQGTDFYIVNNGPRPIEQVFISQSGDRSWGKGRLSGRVIAAGESALFRNTVREGCQGDVRVVLEGGAQLERRNQNLCRVNKMYFNSPAPPKQRREAKDISIRNDSDAPIAEAFIVRAGDLSWGDSLVATDKPIQGKTRRAFTIPTDIGCQVDARVVFPNEQQVDYYNENICLEPVLVFFSPQGVTLAGQPADRPPSDTTSDRPPNDHTANGGIVDAGGSGNVSIINTYRVPLRELYVSPPGLREWERDLLPSDTLVPPNSRYAVRVNTAQDCQFDVRAIWDSDAEQVLRNQNLCNARPLTLRGPPPGEKLWTGTGFYVSHAGHILTNKHVIYGCTSVVIARPAGAGGNILLRVLAQDPKHDLALLQEANANPAPVTFRAPASPLRAGEPSISLGYPIRELLGSQIVTTGIVSSLSGSRGNAAEFQMQTPIQPGNSGGPVFDESGLLIGVATAQITRAGNRAVQNVNFAVKSEIARQFLETQGVTPEAARPAAKLTPADITEQRQKSVLPLTCYN